MKWKDSLVFTLDYFECYSIVWAIDFLLLKDTLIYMRDKWVIRIVFFLLVES